MNWKKEYWKTPEVTAVLAALILGFFVHLFGLIVPTYNCDNINFYVSGYGMGITSGRWFLQILEDLAGSQGFHFNLYTLNGLVFLLFLAVSAGFLVSVFELRGRLTAALMGMLLIVFPTVTATMMYRFTTPPYGLAFLLAVLAAWVLPRFRFGFFLSALCMAFSMGIYQAYVPLTIGIFVLLLIRQALAAAQEPRMWRKLIVRGLYYCAALVLGLALYYLGLKVCLRLYHTSLSSYQGIGDMGKLTLSQLPGLIAVAFREVAMLPFADLYGLASVKLMKIAYFLIYLYSALLTGLLLRLRVKNWLTALAVLALFLIFPVAVNFIVIMCTNGRIYTVMVFGLVLIPCVPLVLQDLLPDLPVKWGQDLLRRGLSLILAVLIFSYGYYANMNYTNLHQTTRLCEQYINSMIVQVRMTEGFRTDMEWAFLGNMEDPMLTSLWWPGNTYGGNDTPYYLLLHSWRFWVKNHSGYAIDQADEETVQALREREDVQAMPCWPNDGSVKIIDNRVVIKFQELGDLDGYY